MKNISRGKKKVILGLGGAIVILTLFVSTAYISDKASRGHNPWGGSEKYFAGHNPWGLANFPNIFLGK